MSLAAAWPRGGAALLLLLACWLAAGCRSTPENSLATHDPSQWEKDIAAFEARDRTQAPPAGCIVFVGSSSVRLWTTLSDDFPGLPVVNRGFGGCQLADVCRYAGRVVIPYRPRQVVVYAGGNDLNAGKSPEIVFGDFVALVRSVRAAVPGVRLVSMSIAPSPKRWAQTPEIRKTNALISRYCRGHGIAFVNTFDLMLGPDGLPKADIYAKDQLHLNERGYALWREALAPHLR